MHRVLIVDDELDVRDAVKRVLERAGYTVEAVESASEALESLRHTNVDVVITDIIMPKVNGVEAIHEIRASFPRVKIIAISGGGNFGITAYQPSAITTTAYLAAAERAGAHLILTKPFESSDLVRAVESVLGVGHA
ncbi:MAG TPA: response regulator [Steroidobacteraceae bacterium]|jgi:CheY-like chemotaxis protein